MKITNKKTGDLIPYANNASVHSNAQIEKIAASITKFGFNNPVLTDGKNGVIAGHGRISAAKLLGMDEVPTIELSHLSPAEKKAYIIADNRLAEMAGWDDDILSIEREELKSLDFDIDWLEFDIKNINESPSDFKEYDEQIETEHKCPKCGYVWSGGN